MPLASHGENRSSILLGSANKIKDLCAILNCGSGASSTFLQLVKLLALGPQRLIGVCAATFARLPPSQWRSLRTTNAIERLHEEFKRRIKTQTVLPSADTAAMLFWALLASGQINMRKVDGWQPAPPGARYRA